jgi:hypothetical protein
LRNRTPLFFRRVFSSTFAAPFPVPETAECVTCLGASLRFAPGGLRGMLSPTRNCARSIPHKWAIQHDLNGVESMDENGSARYSNES